MKGKFPDASGRHAIVEVSAHQGNTGYKTGLTPTRGGDPADYPPMKVDAGSSDKVVLQDNPPGHFGPAGPRRDAAWQAYLAQQSGAKSGTVSPTLVLPNPDAVSDPGLKTVGAAAKQQGVSYTWNGGHVEGKTGVSRGQLNTTRDESWEYNDHQRIGFDCSGLARYATSEGRGIDISADNDGNTGGQYGALCGPGGVGRPVSDAMLKPGDLIYYGPKGAPHHVAIYAGNGLVIQAHGSGTPVKVSPIDLTEQHVNVRIGYRDAPSG